MADRVQTLTLAGAGLTGASRSIQVPTNMVLLAASESESASVLLLRGAYSSDMHLTLVSKALALRATSAMKEGARLDEIEAPRREADWRKQEAIDAEAVLSKTWATNKAAFRPWLAPGARR